MKHSIHIFSLFYLGQIFAAHPADPIGEIAKYSLYGQVGLQLTQNARTSSDLQGGMVGSNSLCYFQAPQKMLIKGELNCRSLKYDGSQKPGGGNSVIFEHDVQVIENVIGGVAQYNMNLTHGGTINNSPRTISGTYSNSSPSYTTPTLPSFEAINTSGSDVNFDWNENSKTLNPGNYGAVHLKSGKVLKLNSSEGGVYHFKSLTFDNGAKLIIENSDTSAVRVLVKGNINMANGSQIKSDVETKALIYSTGFIQINTGVKVYASIVATKGTVTLGNAVKIFGQVLAKKIVNTNHSLKIFPKFFSPDNFGEEEVVQDTDLDGIIDFLDEYPNDFERAANSYYPSKDIFNTLIFEDEWPKKGDFDMNDAVVGFNLKQISNAEGKLKEINFNIKARARGASLVNGFSISINGLSTVNVESIKMTIGNITNDVSPEEGHSGELVIPIIENLSLLLPSTPTHKFYATKLNDARFAKSLSVKLILKTPISLVGIESPPYNPFIHRINNRGIEVHLKGYPATDIADINLFSTEDDVTDGSSKWYETEDGQPFAMEVPGDWEHPENWQYPIEKESISSAYPELIDWIKSKGVNKKTWYQNPNNSKCRR